MQLVHTGENAKCTDRYAKCTSDDPKEERIGKRVNNAKGALNAGWACWLRRPEMEDGSVGCVQMGCKWDKIGKEVSLKMNDEWHVNVEKRAMAVSLRRERSFRFSVCPVQMMSEQPMRWCHLSKIWSPNVAVGHLEVSWFSGSGLPPFFAPRPLVVR